MATCTAALARRIVHDLHAYGAGRPGQWASLNTITRRLQLDDELATDAAVELAAKRGWLEELGGHSIRLTDAGRRLALRYIRYKNDG